ISYGKSRSVVNGDVRDRRKRGPTTTIDEIALVTFIVGGRLDSRTAAGVATFGGGFEVDSAAEITELKQSRDMSPILCQRTSLQINEAEAERGGEGVGLCFSAFEASASSLHTNGASAASVGSTHRSKHLSTNVGIRTYVMRIPVFASAVEPSA